jgi:hypothetical protein
VAKRRADSPKRGNKKVPASPGKSNHHELIELRKEAVLKQELKHELDQLKESGFHLLSTVALWTYSF